MGAIQDIFKKWGNDTVGIIQGNMARTGTNASGETSREIKSSNSDTRVTVDGPAWVFVVETGRGPGGMPPTGKLASWIDAKPVITDNVQNASFAMSKVIAERGTKLFREGGRDDIITPAISDERVDQLTSDIADAILNETAKIIEDGIASSQ